MKFLIFTDSLSFSWENLVLIFFELSTFLSCIIRFQEKENSQRMFSLVVIETAVNLSEHRELNIDGNET